MTTLRISAEYTWNGLNTRSPFSGKDAASSATELEESGFHSSADASSDSMMSAHFVHQGKNDSKYTLARKNGQNALAMQRNRQDSILSMAMTELATLGDEQGGYAKRSLIGRRAARRMSEEQQTAVREHSERNLEEIRDEIEKQAEEATTPQEDTAPEKTDSAENHVSAAPEGKESSSGECSAASGSEPPAQTQDAQSAEDGAVSRPLPAPSIDTYV